MGKRKNAREREREVRENENACERVEKKEESEFKLLTSPSSMFFVS